MNGFEFFLSRTGGRLVGVLADLAQSRFIFFDAKTLGRGQGLLPAIFAGQVAAMPENVIEELRSAFKLNAQTDDET